MKKKNNAPKSNGRRLNALVKAVGKKKYNQLKKEVESYKGEKEVENFTAFAKKYSEETNKDLKKLYAKEIDSFNKRQARKIKSIHREYENKMLELSGASLKDASPEFKKEIRGLMEKQIKVNNDIRAVKKETGARQKFELKYNENKDEVTNFHAWQQADFEKQLLADKYITNVNGYDVKTDMDKILDLLNSMFQKMDSTKVAGVRSMPKDGNVKIFFVDESEVEEGSESEL